MSSSLISKKPCKCKFEQVWEGDERWKCTKCGRYGMLTRNAKTKEFEVIRKK